MDSSKIKVTATRNATPGLAARFHTRNPDRQAEINVKPITNSPVDLKHFVPGQYIRPSHLRRISENLYFSKTDDFGGNVNTTTNNRRLKLEAASMRTAQAGANTIQNPIQQSFIYLSKSPNDFFKKKQEPQPEPLKDENGPYAKRTYQYEDQTPDYLKVLANPSYQKTRSELAGESKTITVLSGSSGWMTVTPDKMDKKNPLEKHISTYGSNDVMTSISKLAPVWMFNQSPASTKNGQPLKYEFSKVCEKVQQPQVQANNTQIPPSLIREHANRGILVDNPQPRRSVFNIGDSRHDKYGVSDSNYVFLSETAVASPNPKHFGWITDHVTNQQSATMRRKEVTSKIGY